MINCLEYRLIICNSVLIGGRGVLTHVSSQNKPFGPFNGKIHGCLLRSQVIKTHPVDQSPVSLQPETARPGITGLSQGSHCPHLNERETKGRKLTKNLGIFIKSGSESDRIGESHSQEIPFKGRIFHMIPTAGQCFDARNSKGKLQKTYQ